MNVLHWRQQSIFKGEYVMRNYIKNSLLDLVETLKELCSEILREYESRHTEYMLELLE